MNFEKHKIENNKKYLETHNLPNYIEEMMALIMREKPEEPLLLMIKYIKKKATQNGVNIPIEYNIEVCDSPINNLKKSTNRSYDKPWLLGSIKKESNNNASININQNTEDLHSQSVKTIGHKNFDLNEEFKLVTESNSNDTNSNITLESSLNNSKYIRPSTKTKETLLKIINEKKQIKVKEKEILESNMNDKEQLYQQYDVAIELSEDPTLYSDEFKIQSFYQEKPDIGVKLVKLISSQNINDNVSVKFGICNECSKFYQSHNNDLINSSCEQDWHLLKDAIVLDDLESASQVNGPRMIDNKKGFSNNSRKKISVSDIETTSKAWPVLETTSESSNKTHIRPKSSGRNFPQ